MLSRVDPEGNASSYAYDGMGRRIAIADTDLGRHSFVFDDAGNPVEHHKPGGIVTKATFDLASRLLTEDWNGDGTAEVVRTYDTEPTNPAGSSFRGELVGATWPGGMTTYGYDERRRLVRTTITENGATYTSGSKYDAQDREYLHAYPDGSSIRIQRTARGLIGGYGKAITFAYDADAREMKRSYNTGVVELNGYDEDRRHSETVATRVDGSVIQHIKWTLDASGNILRVSDLRPSIDTVHDRSEAYGYDNLYRLASASGTWGKTTWKFSPSGNLLDRTSTEASQHAGTLAYGVGAGPHALTDFKGRAIAYDPRGRMKDDGDRTYAWDDGEHLTRVVAKNGATVDSNFDHAGARRLRVEKGVAGESHTTIFLDAWSEVRDGKLLRYIAHGGQRIARLSERNGVPNGTGTSSDSLSEEPPGARSAGAQRGSTASTLPLRLGLQATSLFLTLALIAALVSHYRRELARMTRYSLPLVGFAIICLLAACKGGDDGEAKPPPIEDGTVETLTDDDELLFADQVGSLTETTSGTGAPRGSFATYAFGLPRFDTSEESRNFANTPRDKGVGLDQMGARSYAPELGVWTSGDPLALSAPSRQADARDVGNGNAYAYAAGRPLTHTDRDGHFGFIDDAIATVASPVFLVGATCIVAYAIITRPHPVAQSTPIAPTNPVTSTMDWARQQIPLIITKSSSKEVAVETAKPRDCKEDAPKQNNGGGPDVPMAPTRPAPQRLPFQDLMYAPKERGRAPIGKDGKPVELHHDGQDQNSPLKEMSQTDHRRGENFAKNHPNTGQEPSKIDRPAFDKEREEHWNHEWDCGRFENLPKQPPK